MKHSKWLLTLILILLIINVVFFALWYALDGQGRVRASLEEFLSKTLAGEVKIQKISINERKITANGITYTNKNADIKVNIRQIQVRYNLLSIIKSGFKIDQGIRQITVYEPNIDIRYAYKPPQKKKKPTEIPDLTPYFDKLEIKNGSLNIVFSAELDSVTQQSISIRERLSEINISVINSKSSAIALNATAERQGKFKASAVLDKGLITSIKTDIQKYLPLKIDYTGFKLLDTGITAKLEYYKPNKSAQPNFTIFTQLEQTKVVNDFLDIAVPQIQIQATPTNVSLLIKEPSKINSHEFTASGNLFDYLKNPALKGDIVISSLDLSKFTPLLNGFGKGQFHVEGKLSELTGKGNLQFPMIEFQDEIITGLSIDADYANQLLSFAAYPFNWRNQITSLSGDFDISQTKLDIDFSTNPVYYDEILNLAADLHATVDFSDGLKAEAGINNLEFYNSEIIFSGFAGNMELSLNQGRYKLNRIDLSLSNEEISINAAGDPKNLDLQAEIVFDQASLDDYLGFAQKNNIDLEISGLVNTQIVHSEISGSTDLALQMTSPQLISGDYLTDFAYNLDTKSGKLDFRTENASADSILFSLGFKTSLDQNRLNMLEFNLDNAMTASGWLDFKDLYNSSLTLNVVDLDVARYLAMFVPLELKLPAIGRLSAELDYNLSQDKLVNGQIIVDSVSVPQLKPLNTVVNFTGTTSELDISVDVKAPGTAGLNITGNVALIPQSAFSAETRFTDLNLSDYFIDTSFSGIINGALNWNLYLDDSEVWQHNLAVELAATNIKVFDIPVDFLTIKAAQLNDLLKIDSLRISSVNQVDVTGSGALDYNFLTNRYTGGRNTLNLSVEAEALHMLKTYIPYFTNARGRLISLLTIQANEDGIDIVDGTITMSNGMLKLKDQPESFNNIDLNATISHNQFNLANLSLQIGQGKLFIRNAIDTGDDNFFIGPLNLGYLLIRTSDNGIQISIPDYLASNTAATAVVKGQDSSEATIKGPFDDMEIRALILASNGSAVYPANTKNLLQLINVFQRKPPVEKEALPLPFTLDLLIKIEDNVHYITYPADLICLPGSFLRLTYDGNMWHAQEADFTSEKGTLDFYGTIFQVENVRFAINEQNNIIIINGTFTKKLPDGTTITLLAISNPRQGEDLLNQLEFTLTSDNPDDRAASQILARLRYNKNIDELSPGQRQSLLQDEAMQLISTSVSTTYISQFLSPLENRIRRFLKLDSFSITTGFVQNLFVEFTSDENNLGAFSNSDNLNADILQFSSSILLNNLSLSMGKYIGSKLFLDYEIHLQETTDLAQKSKLDMYHNASIRYNLPWRLRLSYTFSLRPAQEANSHEVMLQRSFRF